jgi:hypothetical protein
MSTIFELVRYLFMKLSRNHFRWSAVGLALTLVALAGCGAGVASRFPVQGAVTFDGQLVDNGAIAFIPLADTTGEQVKAGGQIVDGKYVVAADHGPSAGHYRVEIFWNKKTGRKVVMADDWPNMKDQTKQVIPAKYNIKSSLVVDVAPGRNTFDFNLTSK